MLQQGGNKMFKATDYVVFAFILLVFSVMFMNLGLHLAYEHEHTKLSDESKTYVNSYVALTVDKINLTKVEDSVENLETTQDSNLTTSEAINDYSREYLDTLKSQSKLKFVYNLVANAPTFILMSLGLDIENYRVYINIISWFITIALVIVAILIIKGVV